MLARASSRIRSSSGGGLGESVVCLAGPGLGGFQVCLHLLGRLVGLSAHLVGLGGAFYGRSGLGFGGGRALLVRLLGGVDLGLDRARVAKSGRGLRQSAGNVGQLAGQLPHLPEHLGAGLPGHGDGLLGVRVVGDRGAALLGLEAFPFMPGLEGGVLRVVAVLRRPSCLGRLARGLIAAGELAGRGTGLLGHDALPGLSVILRTNLYRFVSSRNERKKVNERKIMKLTNGRTRVRRECRRLALTSAGDHLGAPLKWWRGVPRLMLSATISR